MAAFGSGAVAAAREEGRSKIQRSRRTPRWLGARRWWMAACCASDGALPASRCQSHRRISAGREFPISASQARKINFSTSTKTIQEARSAVEYATPRPPHENSARKHAHFGLYSPLRKKNTAKIWRKFELLSTTYFTVPRRMGTWERRCSPCPNEPGRSETGGGRRTRPFVCSRTRPASRARGRLRPCQ